MREKAVQNELKQSVEALGGAVRKLAWEGRRGAPDYMILLPELVLDSKGKQVPPPTRLLFTENKKLGGAARFPCDARERAQAREHAFLRYYGQYVFIIDSPQTIKALIAWIRNGKSIAQRAINR